MQLQTSKYGMQASNNGINLFEIIVINNRNYNLKGIIDNYDFCHNRAALQRMKHIKLNIHIYMHSR